MALLRLAVIIQVIQASIADQDRLLSLAAEDQGP